jgi:hypothetical protein
MQTTAAASTDAIAPYGTLQRKPAVLAHKITATAALAPVFCGHTRLRAATSVALRLGKSLHLCRRSVIR